MTRLSHIAGKSRGWAMLSEVGRLPLRVTALAPFGLSHSTVSQAKPLIAIAVGDALLIAVLVGVIFL